MAGDYSTLECSVADLDGVATVQLSRPARFNAVDDAMVEELPRCMAALDADESVRVIVLAGKGKHFCAGIDLQSLEGIARGQSGSVAVCPGRAREALRKRIHSMQAAVSSLEKCRKPVLAAVHGACMGAGVDLITACDICYCTASATFCVKEVDLGITADLGTLQRLPRKVGEGQARELALTAKTIDGAEAARIGLTQGVFSSEDELTVELMRVATTIAAKSPLAVLGTKAVLNFSRDHSVADGLEHVALWNTAMLLSSDLTAVLHSRATKKPPTFSKL